MTDAETIVFILALMVIGSFVIGFIIGGSFERTFGDSRNGKDIHRIRHGRKSAKADNTQWKQERYNKEV